MDDSDKSALADHHLEDGSNAHVDMEAWILNIVSSVALVIANKQVMSVYSFRFASTLVALHLLATAMAGYASSKPSVNSSKKVSIWELVAFAGVSNVAIVAMNLSLMFNSVGFYQIAQLSTVPTVCMLGWIFHRKSSTRDVKIAIFVVLLGVGVCSVTDADVKSGGQTAACVAIVSTALQQIFVGCMQEKHNIGFMELMGKATPIQALLLLVLGPIVDYLLSGRNVWEYQLSYGATFFVVLTCTLAVACNMTQHLFVGRLSAVSYTVLGHMKTSLVLILGWAFFDSRLTVSNASGMIVALSGVVLYGWATAAAATKESLGSLGSFNIISEEDVAQLKSFPDQHFAEDIETAGHDLK